MSTPQANREMVFCHQCENEWYRDEHGLTCPDCHSEFTEIIEPDHDPRDDHLDLDDDFEEEHNPFHQHNPWNAPDPEEGVPDEAGIPPGIRLQRNGPNSYSITGTWSTSFGGPRGQTQTHGNVGDPNAFVNPLFRNFAQMMQGISGAPPPRGEQQQGQGETQPGSSAREETRTGSGPRYAYTSTARLFPRDANNPGPHVEPTDSLHERTFLSDSLMDPFTALDDPANRLANSSPEAALEAARIEREVEEMVDEFHDVLVINEDYMLIHIRVIAGILGGGAFGPPPVQRDHGHGPTSPGGDGGIPPNPLAALFASLLNPQLAAHGDAVYSQEALDRVISQLMEQNATGNAPGPASAEAIAALPKKRVTREMVGAGDAPPDFPEDQLHGECSICMDEVSLGEEVTELPCGHWFHGQCIEAWLREHDTCPHCRKGIEKKEDGQGQQGGNDPSGGAAGSSASGSGSGSGSSSNTPGNNNSGGGASNQPDDTFVPNMPGGLYTSFYRINAPRPQGRAPTDFPLFGIPHSMTFPPLFPPNQDPLDQPPSRHHRQSHRSTEPFLRLYEDPFEYHHHSTRGGNTHTHVIVRQQRRRSSLGRLMSNMGHSMSVATGGSGSAAGGDRPGIGERLRGLFRS